MWVGVILVADKGDIRELKAMLNTDDIFCISENLDKPETTLITFNKDKPAALVKGSFDQVSKIFYGFNRKL